MIKFLYNINSLLNDYHKNLLFIFYLATVFILNYLLLSNEDYLRVVFEKASTSVENKEMIEMTEKGINAIIHNPAMILLLSLEQVWKNAYSISLLIIMCYLFVSFYTNNWISILKIYYLFMSVIIILIFGLILSFSLKYLTYISISWFEFGTYFNYYSLHPFIKKLSSGYEAFTILFLFASSKIISVQYQEKFIAVFFLINLSWLIIIIISYFAGFSVSLS